MNEFSQAKSTEKLRFRRILVHLSEHDSKKYQAILRFKRQLGECTELDDADTVSDDGEDCSRRVDEFGEVATKRITHIQKRFAPEEITILAEKYLAGKSTRKLGEEFGCNRNTVSDVLKRNGIKVRGRGRQKGDVR